MLTSDRCAVCCNMNISKQIQHLEQEVQTSVYRIDQRLSRLEELVGTVLQLLEEQSNVQHSSSSATQNRTLTLPVTTRNKKKNKIDVIASSDSETTSDDQIIGSYKNRRRKLRPPGVFETVPHRTKKRRRLAKVSALTEMDDIDEVEELMEEEEPDQTERFLTTREERLLRRTEQKRKQMMEVNEDEQDEQSEDDMQEEASPETEKGETCITPREQRRLRRAEQKRKDKLKERVEDEHEKHFEEEESVETDQKTTTTEDKGKEANKQQEPEASDTEEFVRLTEEELELIKIEECFFLSDIGWYSRHRQPNNEAGYPFLPIRKSYYNEDGSLEEDNQQDEVIEEGKRLQIQVQSAYPRRYPDVWIPKFFSSFPQDIRRAISTVWTHSQRKQDEEDEEPPNLFTLLPTEILFYIFALLWSGDPRSTSEEYSYKLLEKHWWPVNDVSQRYSLLPHDQVLHILLAGLAPKNKEEERESSGFEEETSPTVRCVLTVFHKVMRANISHPKFSVIDIPGWETNQLTLAVLNSIDSSTSFRLLPFVACDLGRGGTVYSFVLPNLALCRKHTTGLTAEVITQHMAKVAKNLKPYQECILQWENEPCERSFFDDLTVELSENHGKSCVRYFTWAVIETLPWFEDDSLAPQPSKLELFKRCVRLTGRDFHHMSGTLHNLTGTPAETVAKVFFQGILEEEQDAAFADEGDVSSDDQYIPEEEEKSSEDEEPEEEEGGSDGGEGDDFLLELSDVDTSSSSPSERELVSEDDLDDAYQLSDSDFCPDDSD